jgi:hypothetical protein
LALDGGGGLAALLLDALLVTLGVSVFETAFAVYGVSGSATRCAAALAKTRWRSRFSTSGGVNKRHQRMTLRHCGFCKPFAQSSLHYLGFGYAHGLAKVAKLAFKGVGMTDSECHDLNYKNLTQSLTFPTKPKVCATCIGVTGHGCLMVKQAHSYT